MRTTFRIRQPYADRFLRLADEFICNSPVKPQHFIEVMCRNMGSIGMLTGAGLDPEGLEWRNPVICALGDSVTAGHFESLLPTDPVENGKLFKAIMSGDLGSPVAARNRFVTPNTDPNGRGIFPVEITDARESYIEKFREKLIEKYEFTSVSVINAGIAGDVLTMMAKRLQRDVIDHDPDLVLINGSLNWNEGLGTTAEYKEILRGMVQKIKAGTKADIILLTPNGDLPNTMFSAPGQGAPEPTTSERVAAIRELAEEEQVCLADTYAVWEQAKENGIPWVELLANRINHPSVEGHEVYARVLMKLFE